MADETLRNILRIEESESGMSSFDTAEVDLQQAHQHDTAETILQCRPASNPGASIPKSLTKGRIRGV
ncbi:hypothetical protein VTL71DRAFT_10260 [Oculimacula yallundae]|uniref:Uncharacterized protein n=1 Tax=Oculimacula yallundae TaxID=86028 RepID=A0ABR4CU31_9HELO